MSKNFSSNRMKDRKYNSIMCVALVLLLSLSMLASTIPLGFAHTPAWTIPSYAYLSIIPSTQQVNNQVELVMWTSCIPPTAGGTGGDRWHNFKINITAPDGTKSQLGPFDSDQLGSQFTLFTPTQTGTYTLVFYWPGQTLTNGTGQPYLGGIPYVGDYFTPSASNPETLTVQAGPIQTWQNSPTPTGIWERPINALNRDNWGQLASNWLGGAWLTYNYQNEGKAPNTAHILWQTPIPGSAGGIQDAQWYTTNTNVRDYETPFDGAHGGTGPIIMNGIIYLDTPKTANTPKYGYYAYDLATGQQLWYNNGSSIPNGMYMGYLASGAGFGPSVTQMFPQLSNGQLYHYYAANGAGVLSYLWARTPVYPTSPAGTTWYMLDAQTGNWILTIKNVPSGTAVVDQDGSLLVYSYNSANGRLLCWNSSQSIPPAGPTGTGQQQWKPMVGGIIDAVNDTIWTKFGVPSNFGSNTPWTALEVAPRSGYTMNVTIPAGLSGSINAVLRDSNRVPRLIFGFTNPQAAASISGGNGIFSAWCVKINYNTAPYSPYPNETYTQNNNLGYTATLLWNNTYNPPVPAGNLTYSAGPVSYDDQIFTLYSKETRQWWGYSLQDGSLKWGPTGEQVDYDMYSPLAQGFSVAYGNLYSARYGGVIYCYSMSTGELKWKYAATGIGLESPYGNYPLAIGAIADGKVYVFTDLGYVQQPLWRGACVRCVDAYTGKEVWKMYHWSMGLSVADGYLVSGDQYNNMMVCFGKGPSATTVEAAPGLGNIITIQGTITDQSPGKTKGASTKGTAAVSEDSMEQWMEYLYEQQAMPQNATGVPITIYETDPNGNTYKIGTVTSDITGSYAISWTPPMQGLYTIRASFDGSNSYAPSSAVTHIAVGTVNSAAPSLTPTPIPTQPPTSIPNVTPTPETSASPTQAPQPGNNVSMTTYIVAAAVVVIIVVVAAAIILKKRK